MKSWAIILAVAVGLLAGTSISATAAEVRAKTDQRIELLSIVFRLAGNDEYNMNQFAAYVADIDKWFGPYKDHPAVQMAKRLRNTRGVGYDAVMSMAIHLAPPPALEPLIPLGSGTFDKRWGKPGAGKFLKLLREFYLDTRFAEFYITHQSMYTIAESRMNAVLDKVNFDWFRKFFGVEQSGNFNLVLGIGNGGGNYGPKVRYSDGREDLYAIMGTWLIDGQGNPNYNESVLGTIIHEFCHSFANPLVDQNLVILEGPGKALFEPVKEQMKQKAYGDWKTVMYESLVRASSIQYFIDNKEPENQVRRRIIGEMTNGFLWTGQVVELFKVYESNRDTYQALSSFMPRIAGLYNTLAHDIGRLKQEYDDNCAHVDVIEPFLNGATDVDPGLKEITIQFDQPMNPKSGYSISFGDQGAEHFGISGKPSYSEDARQLLIPVLLKPDWDYSFVLMPWSFRTLAEYPLVTYTVKFRTRK